MAKTEMTTLSRPQVEEMVQKLDTVDLVLQALEAKVDRPERLIQTQVLLDDVRRGLRAAI